MSDNIGVGIVTSSNLKLRYNSCKNSWVNDFSNVYFFGGNGLDPNLINFIEAGEDYKSHFIKQQLGFKYMYKDNPNYDWYCMTSCDAILFKNKTIEEIYKFDRDSDFLLAQPCGFWLDNPIHEINIDNYTSGDHRIFRAIAGGAGFFLSNSLMKKCYDIIDEFDIFWTENSKYSYPYSDVAFSYMVYKYFNINLTKIIYLLSQHPSHYIGAILGDQNSKWYKIEEIKEAIKTPMSFHYIKPDEMKEIYEKYK